MVIAARVGVYLAACWLTIGVLANGLFPHAVFAVAALALYTTLPLVAFVKWRGWPFYPNAAFRLLVVRPFWYTQLMLPLVAVGSTLGVLVGSLFDFPLEGGRIAAAVVLTVVGVLLIAGYLGSRQLVVREVDASIPDLPEEFDGLSIGLLYRSSGRKRSIAATFSPAESRATAMTQLRTKSTTNQRPS